MTKRMILMLLGCTVVFGGLFGMQYMGSKGMNAYFDAMPVPAATISSAVATAQKWDNRIEAVGTLVPVQGTNVTTEAAGIVETIRFESGQRVSAGTVLATIDATNERADLMRFEAQAEIAEINRARREKMLALKAVAQSDYDSAVAEAKAAQAAVNAQRAKIAQKEIRAPFNGVLGLRQINVGQYLAPGTPVVSLQTLDPINLDFGLPEQVLPYIQPGLRIEVEVEAYAGQKFAGEVIAVEPQIDVANRVFRSRARLKNPDLKLRSGLFAKVSLILPGEADVIAIPRTAISYNPYGNSVFVVTAAEAKPAAEGAPAEAPGQVVKSRFIKTGRARGDYVEVLEGLKPGEEVATTGLLKLRNDQPVVINNTVQPDTQLNPSVSDS